MMKGAGQEVFMQLMKNHGLFDNLVFSTNLEGRNRKPLALVPTTSSSSSVSSIPCSVSTSSKKLASNDVVDGHQATRKRNGSKSVEQPRIPTLSPKQCHKTIGISERQTEGPSTTGNVIIVGVCAMAKKSQSRPMKEILARLERKFEDITVTIFPQDTILREPVEKWPVCDCLIAFHSDGFPLDKAAAYVNSRRPFVINDIDAQYVLLDRRKVYEILHREKVSFPRHIIVSRGASGGSGGDDQTIFESSNHVVINGHTFSKPFVEKPVSAEDHNVYIYYPDRDGGGSQRLFRKIGGWSSVHSNESQIRKTGSFIYEDYIQTNGQDVKVYTVGPDYAHAEARKSPALDGRVERDSEGREIRYPVVLTQDEKLIAKKICLAFKQTICGFDLLRTSDGKSIVCDVNGFSFVKNSTKYYDDCASILGAMIVREMDQRRGKLLKSVTTTLDSKCQFDLSSK